MLVTGFDIIFFWVARMIMMTLHFTGKVPFRDVYINALVRDAEGQKMSKSKGNTLDPLDLIDGIDARRRCWRNRTAGLLRAEHKREDREATCARISRTAFPPSAPTRCASPSPRSRPSRARSTSTSSRCEGYRNFCNKLWNATRFVLMNTEGKDCGAGRIAAGRAVRLPTAGSSAACSAAEAEVATGFADYRFDNAARAIYELRLGRVLRLVRRARQGAAARPAATAQQRGTRRTLVRVLEAMLRLAHPIIPFITEELWQKVAPLAGKQRREHHARALPAAQSRQRSIRPPSNRWRLLKELTTACRTLRSEMDLPPGQRVPLLAVGERSQLTPLFPYMQTLARLSQTSVVDALPDTEAPTAVVRDIRLMLEIKVDIEAEIARLRKEIAQRRRRSSEVASQARATLRSSSALRLRWLQQERERLAAFEATLEKMRAQLAKLEGKVG